MYNIPNITPNPPTPLLVVPYLVKNDIILEINRNNPAK